MAKADTVFHLTDCGTLNTANATYILDNDVRSEGTCFFVSANGITLDLNGHTITYADLEFTGVQNPGFEEANASDPLDAPGWDLSGAHGNAHRQDHTQKLFFDRYSLNIRNVAGDAHAEESVLTSPVNLPAPGRYALTAEVQGGPYNVLQSRLAIDGLSVTCSNSVSGMHLTYAGDMLWGLICEFDVTVPVTVRGKIIVGTQDPGKDCYLNVDEVDIRPIDDNRDSRLLGMSAVRTSGWNRKIAGIKNGRILQGRSKAVYSSAI